MICTSFDPPPDAIASHGKQSDPSSTPHRQRESFPFTETNSDKNRKLGENEEANIQSTLSTEQYVFNVQFDDGPPDVAKCFCKGSYRIKMLICVTSNALLTMAN